MNPYYPPPFSIPDAPFPHMSSSATPVLGKRKHDNLTAQSGEFGTLPSQALGHRFPARQFQEMHSIESMSSRYQVGPSALPGMTFGLVSGSTATTPARPAIFIHSTVESMQEGQRPTIDRNQTYSFVGSPGPSPVDIPGLSLDALRTKAKAKAKPKRQAFLPSRPVQNSKLVHTDVWAGVFSFCEPKLLLELKTLSRFHYELLSDNSVIWRNSRIHHYGADMPECPRGLTEKQYVELLAGRGCQSKDCHLGRTFKVHWTFQVRLCSSCFKQKTMSESALAVHRRHRLPMSPTQVRPNDNRALWELLPLARTDGRRDNNSRHVDTETNDWVHAGGKFTFLRTSFDKIEAEFQRLRGSDPSNNAVMVWADKIHKETMEFMAEVNTLEAWFKEHGKTTQNPAGKAWRQKRIDFFQARAAELEPPMDSTILSKMAAFIRNLKIATEPTDRMWDQLKPKIEPYRLQAHQVVEFERVMKSERLESEPQVRLFRRLQEHRRCRKAAPPSFRPEQRDVLICAHLVYKQCVKENVADEDLLLLCLERLFVTYHSRDRRAVGLNYDGTTGQYCLSLDDARMVVEEVLEKAISPHSERGRIVFQSLRCRGCTRNDHVRTWSFVSAFEHILETHARKVGEGLEYYQFAIPHPVKSLPGLSSEDTGVEYKFPWYTAKWPISLPLVPCHQDISKLDNWHPNVQTKFTPLPMALRMSAFHGRQALQQKHAADDFGPNLVYAAEQLNGIWLPGPSQMKIALKYALDLYAQKHVEEPPLSAFMACLDDLATVNTDIELKFRCGICVNQVKTANSNRSSKNKADMENIHRHWDHSHGGGAVSWGQGLMDLPNESQILREIVGVDDSLQGKKDAFVEREHVRASDLKKRKDPKSKVLFKVTSAAEAFDGLFPKVAEE
ncbi:hypothetical protein AYO20_11130 [Fonsecaea nubica]|uniref:F-box domain-containing protein n=1 Tax=Fonsecaea nubica TaxID=856822 RepID=A0A178C1U3_9EURO|nr:hypothetical protein AYO20_11130 [Fonsecaea nubica]OAL22731.1 hypothetical protein AYO20_11130 [Fonsecaea nubica]